MGDSDPAGRILLLKPDTRNLNTAGHGNYPFNPSGVDQCRALWTRIFILRSRTIQSYKGAAVFLAQNAHEGGKTFSGVATSDLIL